MNAVVQSTAVETILPEDADSAQILSLVEALEARGETVEAQPVIVTADGVRHEIPQGLADVLVTVAKALALNQGVSIVPRHRLLTTQEGADMLNISRPTFIKILEEGTVPFEMRGSHRRIRLQSVLDYQKSLKAQRAEALDLMQQQGREDGIYDVLNAVMDED
ncbi:excisionase family DNA-binding protein [Corynebacterium sp. AOP40-9SA-29]|uniref:excisionase family DNA-binding protein n=1 Tax=Corynebacterium sp. AOP40-9SA-29 TaxID=3457677 RepID=UPI0040344F43